MEEDVVNYFYNILQQSDWLMVTYVVKFVVKSFYKFTTKVVNM